MVVCPRRRQGQTRRAGDAGLPQDFGSPEHRAGERTQGCGRNALEIAGSGARGTGTRVPATSAARPRDGPPCVRHGRWLRCGTPCAWPGRRQGAGGARTAVVDGAIKKWLTTYSTLALSIASVSNFLIARPRQGRVSITSSSPGLANLQNPMDGFHRQGNPISPIWTRKKGGEGVTENDVMKFYTTKIILRQGRMKKDKRKQSKSRKSEQISGGIKILKK